MRDPSQPVTRYRIDIGRHGYSAFSIIVRYPKYTQLSRLSLVQKKKSRFHQSWVSHNPTSFVNAFRPFVFSKCIWDSPLSSGNAECDQIVGKHIGEHPLILRFVGYFRFTMDFCYVDVRARVVELGRSEFKITIPYRGTACFI